MYMYCTLLCPHNGKPTWKKSDLLLHVAQFQLTFDNTDLKKRNLSWLVCMFLLLKRICNYKKPQCIVNKCTCTWLTCDDTNTEAMLFQCISLTHHKSMTLITSEGTVCAVIFHCNIVYEHCSKNLFFTTCKLSVKGLELGMQNAEAKLHLWLATIILYRCCLLFYMTYM